MKLIKINDLNFKKIDINDYKTNVFVDFKNTWALATAGTLEDHNTLTIGWGSLGVLWRKNVCTIYVRGSRHTYNYLEKSDYFTVSFYDKDIKENFEGLRIYGTLSGRDNNKDELTRFTPIKIDGGISYSQANTIIVCKKIYADEFKPNLFLDDGVKEFYEKTKEDPTYHHYYIGEIIGIYQK